MNTFEKSLIFLIALLNTLDLSPGARILAIIPTPAFSHQVVFRPLWKELARRGHQVVLLTTDVIPGEKDEDGFSNLQQVDLHEAYKIWNIKDVAHKHKYNLITSLNQMFGMIESFLKIELEHPEVQAIIRNETEHFDLVFVEYLFPVMTAFSQRFNCPFIGVVSMDATNYVHRLMGNPAHPVLYSDFQMPFAAPLNFFERVFSTFFDLVLWYYEQYLSKIADSHIRKYFGDHFPSLDDISANISMLFVNSNPFFQTIRPLGPTTIQIGGGIHIDEPKPLPEEISDFLDDTDQGAIYFSLGTNVKGSSVSLGMRQVLNNTFKNLPYKILWKFDEDLTGLPDNVKVVKWAPQQDILGHPKIKLFITQGGLQSIEESIHHKIPMVGLPYYGDQFSNMDIVQKKELGKVLDKDSMTEKLFTDTILEVIRNPKYKQNVKKLEQLIEDQPMTGLEKAIWWTEYVLRHNGAKHLRNPAADMPLYQLLLLDVLLFIASVITIVTIISLMLLTALTLTIKKIFQVKLKTN